MDVNGSRGWANLKVYAVCLAGCSGLLAAAGVAFSISTDMVGPAAAQVEQRSTVDQSRMLAALPAFDQDVHRLFPASKRPDTALPRSVVPVVISRVPDHAAPVPVVEESASPDIDEWANYRPWTPDRTDTFRTVCVRLCDGSYFPISFATTRDRFKADAAKCKSSCGSPAKLFVGPPDGAADDLVDVRGSQYADLPNAFKYRTSYDASCTCKAQPWEAAEIERHRQLADVARRNAQETVRLAEAPAVLPHSVGHVEIAAIEPSQSPRETGVRTVTTPVVVQSRDANVQMPAARSPAGRAAVSTATAKVAGSSKVVTTKTNTGKKQLIAEIGIAATATPRVNGRPKIAQLDASSTQRPFRAKEYWRLSYWEAPGF